MKVLVIPDIHLKSWLFDRAEEALLAGKAERAVCLMDIPDDWGQQKKVRRYEEVFDRAIAFAKSFPETVWCYGNHDVCYLWGKGETGYSPFAAHTVRCKLAELSAVIGHDPCIVARIDKALFMHGGLCEEFLSFYRKNLLTADIDTVIDTVNKASDRYLWRMDSPLWCRPQNGFNKMFRTDEFVQVVGHSPVREVWKHEGVISTDVFSTVPDGKQVGKSEFLILDTKTLEGELLPIIPGGKYPPDIDDPER